MLLDLPDAIAPVLRPFRARVLDVRTWALAAGQPVDADILALLLAGKTTGLGRANEPLDLWTRIGVYHELFADVPNWCSAQRVLVPLAVPETLWQYLSYLHQTGRLAPGSDPIRELRRPLRCYGGLGADGLVAPPGARRVACVCKVPYQPPRRAAVSGSPATP